MQPDHESDDRENDEDSEDESPARSFAARAAIGSPADIVLHVRGAVRIRHGVRGYRDMVSPSNQAVSSVRAPYTSPVPKIWTETIQAHRREVRNAILDTTAALVAEHGFLAVTMSQIAEETGIGRATLYKYFPDVKAILRAWHERQIAGHLAQLAEIRDQADAPLERLEAVLQAYAMLSRHGPGHHVADFEAFLHQDEQVARAKHEVHKMVRGLLIEAAKTGDIRDDVAPDELASYCIHALGGAAGQRSKAAVHRLVSVTLTGLRQPREGAPPHGR
jgi:AcrR family transcriptional regulator